MVKVIFDPLPDTNGCASQKTFHVGIIFYVKILRSLQFVHLTPKSPEGVF